MKVLVIGGKLQGLEISYLAREAGWDVTVLDKNSHALASRLCNHFVCVDVLKLESSFFSKFDLVYPAVEDIGLLRHVDGLTQEAGVPFAFDEEAYLLSHSKIRSNAFLQSLSVAIPPLPEKRPSLHDEFELHTYIVKPDKGSSSKGVRVFDRRSRAFDYVAKNTDCFVQSFLPGPIYSIEVVCSQNEVRPFMVTEVCVDEGHDCHRILASNALPAELSREIAEIAQTIGRALDMKGIFDIELVLHGSRLYVIEIDARMPSQTPVAVYHATGINLVVETALGFIAVSAEDRVVPKATVLPGERGVAEEGTFTQYAAAAAPQAAPPPIAQDTPNAPTACPQLVFAPAQTKHCVILQHVRIEASLGDWEFIGEGRLAESPPLRKLRGLPAVECVLFGRDDEGGRVYATLIVAGKTEEEAEGKLNEALVMLCEKVRSYDSVDS